jgi:hypothetical protein
VHHEIPSALIWRNQPHRSGGGQELQQFNWVTLAYANADIAKFVTRGVLYDCSGTSIQGRIAKRHQAFSLEKLPHVCIGTGKAVCAEEEREKACSILARCQVAYCER